MPTRDWTRQEIIDETIRQSTAGGADPAVVLAVFEKESGFDETAIGDGGDSVGLRQLNRYGQLNGRSFQWAKDPANAIPDAVRALAKATTATAATKVQNPARPDAYADGLAPLIEKWRKQLKGVAASTSLWVTGDKAGLNPDLLSGLAYVGKKLGKKVNVVSGKRSRAEQEKLYQSYLNGTGNLAAKPGTSNHESGNAADVYVSGKALASYPGGKEAAAEVGIGFPVGGEPWHAEIVDPSKAGTSDTSSTSSASDDGMQTVGFGLPDQQTVLRSVFVVLLFVLGLALFAFGIVTTFRDAAIGQTIGKVTKGAA